MAADPPPNDAGNSVNQLPLSARIEWPSSEDTRPGILGCQLSGFSQRTWYFTGKCRWRGPGSGCPGGRQDGELRISATETAAAPTTSLCGKIGRSPHEMHRVRAQTDLSAPGVGTAAAKHHRDMMWLLRIHRPRPRDYRRNAVTGAIDFWAGSRLAHSANPSGTGPFRFASSVNSYLRAASLRPRVSRRDHTFRATPALQLANQ